MTTPTATEKDQTTIENITEVANVIGKLAGAGLKSMGVTEEISKQLGKLFGTPSKVEELVEAYKQEEPTQESHKVGSLAVAREVADVHSYYHLIT